MPAVNILIKPASSACNLRCAYCFYRDEAEKRQTAFQGMLTLETMEKVVKAGMEYAEAVCSFTFQGGEPMLAGLEFFRGALALEKKYRRPGVEIRNAIQTNGTCVSAEWAQFFSDHHFLVGLSLDGPAALHDLNRKDAQGKGSFNRVIRAARLFDRYHVDYNVLCVVTEQNARSVQSIYNFYKKQNFRWLQFLPCLEPLGQERGQRQYALTGEEYARFLVRLFDLWEQDLNRGERRSIRHLDNWMSIMLGDRPEACSMVGCCSIQFVVEGDGGVYPCDFYVLDKWRLGTVGVESLAEMQSGPTARRFLEASRRVPAECRQCEFFSLCRNGCRRERLPGPDGEIDRNYFCEAYRHFFAERGDRLRQALGAILRM